MLCLNVGGHPSKDDVCALLSTLRLFQASSPIIRVDLMSEHGVDGWNLKATQEDDKGYTRHQSRQHQYVARWLVFCLDIEDSSLHDL
jgi:hypothetical protein